MASSARTVFTHCPMTHDGLPNYGLKLTARLPKYMNARSLN